VVEPLITLRKPSPGRLRRLAFARLRYESVVEKLFDDLGSARRRGRRLYPHPENGTPPGDSADMALMSLVTKPPRWRKRKGRESGQVLRRAEGSTRGGGPEAEASEAPQGAKAA